MDDPANPEVKLVFSGILNEDDACHVARVGREIVLRRHSKRKYTASILAIIVCIYAVACILPNLAIPMYFVIPLFISLFWWAYFKTTISIQGWRARRDYRKRNVDYALGNVTLTENRVRYASESYCFDYDWVYIRWIAATHHGLLFRDYYDGDAFFLPNRVFDEKNTRDAVLKLAKQKSRPVISPRYA